MTYGIETTKNKILFRGKDVNDSLKETPGETDTFKSDERQLLVRLWSSQPLWDWVTVITLICVCVFISPHFTL